MPLFDLAPKESDDALFGRGREVERLTHLVEERRWVVVLGPRMVGKTSLVKVVRRRLKRPGAYVNLWGVKSVQGLIDGLIVGLNESASLRARLTRAARNIEGVSVGPGGLSLSAPAHPLRTAWALLDLLGSERGDCLVILDEIQELSSNSGALLKLLGNIFNTRPNVVFVFTGSLVGLSRTLLDPSSGSPLLGRSPASMVLGPFERPTSEAYLTKGAAQAGIQLRPGEITEVLDGPLDGTPGWLTLYGNHRTVGRMSHTAALTKTIDEGKTVAEAEVAHFMLGRDPSLYWPALKTMALGGSWSTIRDAVSRSTLRTVNDAVVQRIVRASEACYLAKNVGGTYQLEDPMVRRYLLEAGRPPGVTGRPRKRRPLS
jgi:AAA+ ATPase superfamily predicted ATPase